MAPDEKIQPPQRNWDRNQLKRRLSPLDPEVESAVDDDESLGGQVGPHPADGSPVDTS
jgi:hypothetical protein